MEIQQVSKTLILTWHTWPDLMAICILRSYNSITEPINHFLLP